MSSASVASPMGIRILGMIGIGKVTSLRGIWELSDILIFVGLGATCSLIGKMAYQCAE